MSEYIWHHEADGPPAQMVIVLAWHEGHVTVLNLDANGDRLVGASPYLVRYSDLRFGRPPAEAVAA